MVVELSCTFQCVRITSFIGYSSLKTLIAYFVCNAVARSNGERRDTV